MKGAIAAFAAAAAATPAEAGTISLIVTGDEEGPAIFGTRALMEHMDARGLRPDMILVGEPTSVQRLGDMMKIGRPDRKSGGSGKSVAVRVDLGGRRNIKKKKENRIRKQN